MLASVALASSQVAAQSTREIHDAAIVLDTHFDTPANLGRPGWSILDRHDTRRDGDQVDLPRMIEGGVDGGFFAIYTPQGPRTDAGRIEGRQAGLIRAAQIREMIAAHPTKFELALTADDARRIGAAGKRFVFMSMENGTPVEADLSLMRTFRALGVTTIGPVHTRNNELADSSTDKPEWNGLSPRGREFVAEANRLGMLIDGSHASDEATRQMVALSKAPIMLTHSGMRGVYNHPRNVPDDVARAIAAKGGVIQLNVLSGYMIDVPKIAERDAAIAALYRETGSMDALSVAAKQAYLVRRAAIDRQYPIPRAKFTNFIDHVNYAVRLVGKDHIGISGDFDGGGGIDGLDDITAYPQVTEALVAAGFSASDVAKFWGGNALRVLTAAQAVAEPGMVPTVVPITK